MLCMRGIKIISFFIYALSACSQALIIHTHLHIAGDFQKAMVNKLASILVGVIVTFTGVRSHTYHLGSCPTVEPMKNFDMSRFLGKWYVIQKTSTGSRCISYNFTQGSGVRNYSLEQVSEHFLLGLTNVDHQYHYTGLLSVPDSTTPSKMTVRFPLSVAGSASYTVLDTDYDTYAGVFTCQKITFANRQSASILSRRPTLDKIYIDKIRNKLSNYNVDPFEMSIIDQQNCKTNSSLDIDINPNTFSAGNIAGLVRTAGEKIGDGIEAAAEGTKKLYNHFRDNDNSDDRREELTESSNNLKDDAEWLP